MELAELVVPLKIAKDSYDKGIADASAGASGLATAVAGIGSIAVTAAIAAVTAAVAGLGLALQTSLSNAQEWGETLDSVQDLLGVNSNAAAGLAVMAETLGIETDGLNKILGKMVSGLYDAEGALGPTGKAIDGLGISLTDASGKTKDADILLGEIANKINAMPDGLDKTSKLMDIFGKSGAEMGDILAAVADGGMANYILKAQDMGLAISQDDINNAIELGKAQREFDLTLKGLSVTIGNSLIPVLTPLIKQLSDWLQDPVVQNGIKELAKDILNFGMKVIEWLPVAVKWFKDELLPPLRDLWATFNKDIVPVLRTLFDILGVIAPPIMKAFVEGWRIQIEIFDFFVGTHLRNLIKGFEMMIDLFKRGVEWVENFRNSLSTLSLPDWLTPGSPTPFENGLRGINSALKELSMARLPEFNAEVNAQSQFEPIGGMVMTPAYAGAPGQGDTFVLNYNPFVSTVDQAEVERVLKPYIVSTMRSEEARRR